MSIVYKKNENLKDSGVEWIGEIPLGWQVGPCLKLFSISKDKVEEGKLAALSVGYMGVVPQLANAAKNIAEGDRKHVKPGDIVINSRSDRMGAAGHSKHEGGVSLVYHVLRQKTTLDTRYFHYVFKNIMFSSEFYRQGNGIVADLWTTKDSALKKISVPSPSISTQKEISVFLDKKTGEIDKFIEKKQKLIELLKELRITIITKAVTKGLNRKVKTKNSRIGWIGRIPEDWNIGRLRFLVNFNPGKSKVSKLGDQVVSFLPMPLVSETGILDLSIEKNINSVYSGFTYFANGDVIVAKITPCFENFKGAVARELVNGIAFGSTEFHILRPKKIHASFLYYITMSHTFRGIGELEMRGAAGQQRVPVLFLKDFICHYPNSNTQTFISTYLDKKTKKIDDVIEHIQKQIEKLQEYRASLIYNVITGKVKV